MPRKNEGYRRLDTVLIALLLLVAAILWWNLFTNTFLALPYNDSLDYASIGRNIARGDGVTSAYLTPLGLSHHEHPQPNLWRAPLWPLVLGGAQAVAGDRDGVVAAAGGLCFLGGIIPLYLLSRRLFSREVAVACGLVYASNPWNLQFSQSGLTETLGILVLLFWMYFFMEPGWRNSRGDYLMGAWGGLFYLARYNAVAFLPPVALGWLWARRSREPAGKVLARFALGGLLVTGPWLLRNLLLFGNPMFSLQQYEIPMFSSVYPGYTLYMKTEPVDVAAFIRQHSQALGEKVTENLEAFSLDFWTPEFTGLPAWAVVLALVSVLWIQREERRLHLVLTGSFLLQLLALSLIHYIPRLFFVFFPFFVLLALGGAYRLLARFLPGSPVPGLAVLALAGVLIWSQPIPWEEPNLKLVLSVQLEEPLADINELVPADQVVVSNDGHLVAWYSDRPAVKIPLHPEQLPAIEERAPVGAIFLSRHIHWNTPEAHQDWLRLYQEQPRHFQGFRRERVYDTGCVLYLREEGENGARKEHEGVSGLR